MRRSWTVLPLVLASVFYGSQVFAKTTIVSIGGVSAQSSVTSGTDTSATTTITIYGGYTNSATCNNATTVCDSCAGKSDLTPCNRQEVNPNLHVNIQLQTDSTSIVGIGMARVGSTGSGGIGTVTTPSGGGTYYADIPWNLICSNGGSDSACSSSFSTTLTVGLSADNGSTFPNDSVSIQVVFSAISNAASTYTRCKNGVGSSAGDGFCDLTIRPGDGKVYAHDAYHASDWPATPAGSNVKWTGLTFFYKEDTSVSPSIDGTTLGTISTSSDSATISYDNTKSPPTYDERITGLNNESRYCFIMANQDAAGNIYKFSNPADYATSSSELCGTPDQVLGLLDGKKCFIATAAWGSAMDPHVVTLRSFRDEFLQTNFLGRAFVKTYYHYSPPVADFIARHETLRAAVRFGLWPLVGFATLSLAGGPIVAALVLVGLFVMAALMGAILVRRRKQG